MRLWYAIHCRSIRLSNNQETHLLTYYTAWSTESQKEKHPCSLHQTKNLKQAHRANCMVKELSFPKV